MSMKGVFRRPEAVETPNARFYVKGSYVLDYVFGRAFARDIDVFFERRLKPPDTDTVRAWLRERGLPDAEVVECTPVDDLESCSGGGNPFFSFERWNIQQDGLLYTLEETGETSGVLALWGQPAHKTRIVPLSRQQAKDEPRRAFQAIEDISCDEAGLKYVSKLLEKMTNHPELELADVEERLRQQKLKVEASIAGEAVGADGDEAENDEHEAQ